MKKIIFIFFLFFLFQNVYSKEIYAFFIPPSNWEIVNPKYYPNLIVVSFIKKEFSTCRPTMNLATEKTILNLDEYTNEAKKKHIKEHSSFKVLDKIALPQGTANICQIIKNTNSIDFEILQMFFIKDTNAYVLTACCKKKDILDNYQIFIEAFKSFKIVDDLFSLILDKQKKAQLSYEFNKLTASLNPLNPKENKKKLDLFEKYLDKKFTNLGKYFKVLLIKKAYNHQGQI